MSASITKFQGTSASEITPDDNNPIPGTAAGGTGPALWVGTGGDLEVELVGAPGKAVFFRNIPDSTLMPIQVYKLRSGTTCTDITAVF